MTHEVYVWCHGKRRVCAPMALFKLQNGSDKVLRSYYKMKLAELYEGRWFICQARKSLSGLYVKIYELYIKLEKICQVL